MLTSVSSLFFPQSQKSKIEDRLDAAWRRYNAAFDAVKVAYGLEARTVAVAECQAATKELIAARKAAAGQGLYGRKS